LAETVSLALELAEQVAQAEVAVAVAVLMAAMAVLAVSFFTTKI
jgi:hypothetical protein